MEATPRSLDADDPEVVPTPVKRGPASAALAWPKVPERARRPNQPLAGAKSV
jgi:hypothetical protein